MGKYRIELKKETKGQILVVYEAGFLKSVLLDPKDPEKLTSFPFLMQKLPYAESALKESGLPVEVVGNKDVYEKVKLFCQVYKTYCRVSYTSTPQERNLLKGCAVSEPLLRVYFESTEWWASPKSMGGYCRNISEVQRIAALGKGVQYPNGYDKAWAAKQSPQDLAGYWKHLRDNGMKPKYSPTGDLIDWTKDEERQP